MTPVQLGAGTALPSITLTQKWLSTKSQHHGASPKLQLCLADYNRSVLELATIPNLYLSLYFRDKPIIGNEIETKPDAVQQFEDDLAKMKVTVTAISGSWTPELAGMVSSTYRVTSGTSHETIVLASETIYSPATIRSFTETLLSILGKAQEQGSTAKALVAAKRVYFGVGGGIDEFLRVLGGLGGRGHVVWESQGAGVGRVIIEVTLPTYPSS